MLNFCIIRLILCLKFLLILNLMFRWRLIQCERLNLRLIDWLSIWCNEKLNIRWRYDFLLNILMRWLKFLTFCLIFFIFWSPFRFNFRWIERIFDVSFILCLSRVLVDLKRWIQIFFESYVLYIETYLNWLNLIRKLILKQNRRLRIWKNVLLMFLLIIDWNIDNWLIWWW